MKSLVYLAGLCLEVFFFFSCTSMLQPERLQNEPKISSVKPLPLLVRMGLESPSRNRTLVDHATQKEVEFLFPQMPRVLVMARQAPLIKHRVDQGVFPLDLPLVQQEMKKPSDSHSSLSLVSEAVPFDQTKTIPTSSFEKSFSEQKPVASPSLLPPATEDLPELQFEDINAKIGDEVALYFSKPDWVYGASHEEQNQVGFIESRREKDTTHFLFRPQKTGIYELEFSRQNLASGFSEARKIKLHVVERESVVDRQTKALFATPKAAKKNQLSHLLQKKGKYSQAVEKLLEDYDNNDTKSNFQLGKLLCYEKQEEEALKYLDRNLTHPSAEFQDSLVLASKIALKKQFQDRLPQYIQLWKEQSTHPAEDLYLHILESLSSWDINQALAWADLYTIWYRSPEKNDHFLYFKANILSQPGPQRDVSKAWSLYNQIARDYPLSPWWEESGAKAAYIYKRFLQVR